ncbi:ABC-type polar amino acid transport system ATPase subunit [Bradyrhizobium sp. i1.3.1]
MIEISHVNKWYTPTFQVLTDCTTSVTKGEVASWSAAPRARASRR